MGRGVWDNKLKSNKGLPRSSTGEPLLTSIFLSAHPVLQIKKRTSKATFACCKPKRHKEEGIDLKVMPDD